jgi:phosphohistidine phosphatase
LLLYLIRHAEAEAIGLGGVTRDFDRPLTAHGREQARVLAKAFLNHNLALDAIATSPLVRAYQTATEFMSILAPGRRPVMCDHLGLEKLRPHHLSQFLTHLPSIGERIPTREEKSVVAIGHMPDLGTYLEWLIGAGPKRIHIAKGGIACVRFEDEPIKASGELRWLIPPDWSLP